MGQPSIDQAQVVDSSLIVFQIKQAIVLKSVTNNTICRRHTPGMATSSQETFELSDQIFYRRQLAAFIVKLSIFLQEIVEGHFASRDTGQYLDRASQEPGNESSFHYDRSIANASQP